MKTTLSATRASSGRRKFLKLAAAATGAASLGVTAPVKAQRARTLRFGHMLPTDTVYHKAIVMFADEAGKLSSGRIKIEIYPSSQLGTIPEMLSATKVGSLNLTMAVPAWYSNHMKPVDAFTLPYIVSSPDRLKASLDGTLGKEVERLGDAAGFHVLGYWLIGSRHIVNKIRPINKPADCQGLKVRVINSQVYIQTFRALGASTVSLDPCELYVALQQGIVDGFEYPLPDLLSIKLYEVPKFISLDAHTTDFFIISINKGQWDAMPAEDQAILTKAMRTAMEWQWKAQPENIAEALVKLKTLIAVNDITPENKKLFVEVTRPIYKQFEPSIGKDFLELAVKELGLIMTAKQAPREASGPDRVSLRRELLEAERALYRAQVAGSVDAIRPLLGANLVYIHSTGVTETRDEYLDGVANGLYEYGEIGTRDTRVQLFGDVAMINGVVDMTVSAHGAAKTLIHLLFCLVWIREDGAWRLDFRQATRIPSKTT